MTQFDQLVPLLATVAVSACAHASSPAQMAPPASGSASASAQWVEEALPHRDCSITVVFGSFATGPDRGAMLAVDRLLVANPAVSRVTRSPYGREGEHSLCIRTLDRTGATRLFNSLTLAVGHVAAAPVTIVGPDRSFVVPTGDRGQRRH